MARFTQARPPCTRTARCPRLCRLPFQWLAGAAHATAPGSGCAPRPPAQIRACRVRHHARLQACSNSCVSPAARPRRAPHRPRRPRRDQIHARPGAKRLIWYSRQGRVRLANTVSSAGAQPEHFLQKLNSPSPPRRWGTGQSSGAFVHRPTVVRHARKDLARRVTSAPAVPVILR